MFYDEKYQTIEKDDNRNDDASTEVWLIRRFANHEHADEMLFDAIDIDAFPFSMRLWSPFFSTEQTTFPQNLRPFISDLYLISVITFDSDALLYFEFGICLTLNPKNVDCRPEEIVDSKRCHHGNKYTNVIWASSNVPSCNIVSFYKKKFATTQKSVIAF